MNQNIPPSDDASIEVIGYKTDPLRRGFQTLTNYECTYWRALVGNEAWSLYEVLRSFCHQGNNSCKPSINLLKAVLGIKEKRGLTGRITKVKGKEFKYPGLIDILQNYDLITAEIKGQTPSIRYVYHVDLAPGLLVNEQLIKLPKILQKKHDEILKRCEQAKQELESKKRPSKISVDTNYFN